ncbi:MAG: methyltransferase domain-containing protein [Candidatus Sericytochromatia bacterium]|nr:methyltransferase domain-containing protein [Candidatus Sericytochromatia bacterium]
MTFPEGWRIPQPYHHMMLINERRMKSFRFAITKQMIPGCVVLEIGAGSGVLSAIAARAGARKVYAVERDVEMAEVARRVMTLNGLNDIVEVITANAENFSPPEQPHLVICEMLHVGLVNEQQVPVMRAVLSRLGQTNLRTIPYAVVNALQLVEMDYHYEGFEIPIIRSSHPHLEDQRIAAVSEPVTYWVCYMGQPETGVDICVPLLAERDGTANGISLISKAVLTEEFEHPDNDWYLFQLQFPLPARPVFKGQVIWVRLAYRAGCPLSEMTIEWQTGPERSKIGEAS